DRTRFATLLELLGETTPIAAITSARIETLTDELGEVITRFGSPMTAASVHKHLELLRAAMRLPDAKKCVVADPFVDVKLIAVHNKRDRICSPEEYEALIGAAPTSHLRLAIVLGYWTGMRCKEIAELRWKADGEHGWIDMREAVVRLPELATKTKKDRPVPLPPEVIAAL